MRQFTKDFLEKIKNFIQESQVYAQIHMFYQQLDRRSQNYVVMGLFFGSIALFSGILLFFIILTAEKQDHIDELKSTISYLQSASAEIQSLKRRIQQKNSQMNTGLDTAENTLSDFVQSSATHAMIAKTGLDIKEASDTSEEVSLAKISLKQLVNFIFSIENPASGITVKTLSVDTKNDPKGYLWANLTVEKSAKTPTTQQNKTSR